MLIDWFTVGAQVINFVLLVWLMKRVLYQPVLDAIAAREQRIAEQIAGAAAQAEQASSDRKNLADKHSAFDLQRADLLEQASAAARAEGQRLADVALQAATALAAQRRQALALQAAQLQQSIAARAAHEVFAISRKTLTDLASVSLEAGMVEVFTRRLHELPAAARAPLAAALVRGAESGLVRSRFDLSVAQQAAIQTAIDAAFCGAAPLRFETGSNAVCGIELSAGGQKLAWTIDGYLRDLEHAVTALLDPPATAVARPGGAQTPTPAAGPVAA